MVPQERPEVAAGSLGSGPAGARSIVARPSGGPGREGRETPELTLNGLDRVVRGLGREMIDAPSPPDLGLGDGAGVTQEPVMVMSNGEIQLKHFPIVQPRRAARKAQRSQTHASASTARGTG